VQEGRGARLTGWQEEGGQAGQQVGEKEEEEKMGSKCSLWAR